jgi:1-acyl-sn-glycerol-3-phosphate acyltransferase
MKRPNIVLYGVLGLLVKVYAFFKGHRIIKKTTIKGPAVILSNHTSFYDFIYTTAAMFPKRVSYFAASKMFYEPVTGFLLRLARAIPKSLMQADPVATLKAFRVLRKKGIISVFPEGQISPTGAFMRPAFAIAKFLKKAKADVYVVKHMNAYCANPPWSKHTFKGRVETEKRLIIEKDSLVTMSYEEIYETVCRELDFVTSAYNMDKRYTYRLKDITNLENVIYQCPMCLHEGLVSMGTHLSCPSCGHHMAYDQYGLLAEWGIDQWFEEQASRLRHHMKASPEFALSAKTRLQSFRNNRLVNVGEGVLTLKRYVYDYEGTVDGKQQRLSFLVKSTPTLPSDIGRNIQIYEGDQIFQFEMDVAWLPTKFVHAGEAMFDEYHQEKRVS